MDIYRKPTTTDTTINFNSNHPVEHKMAAFRSHIYRMHSLPLTPEKKQKEWQILQTTANNNNFPTNLLHKLNQQIQQKIHHTLTERNDKKLWTTFTYHSPKIRKHTNLFKNTNVGTAFRTTTTIHQLTKPTIADLTLEREKSGVYKLTCNTCQRSYIGQTSGNLKSRFQEHTRYIKNNGPHSA
jgi:DNA mismatch repair ATPase MutS